jgi:hypothetical protein
LERLEDRLVPTVYTVTTPVDLSIATGVNNTTGAIIGTGGIVTLRSAIQASNNNPTTGGNTIVLPSGTYTLGIAPRDSDGNDTGDLNILSGSVTIQGAGPANTVIDGGGLDRVLNLGVGLGAPLSLTLEDLTIQNGIAPYNANATALGGGILVNAGATLALTDVRITNNQAGSPFSTLPRAIGEGGGIAALFGSTLTLTNVLMDSNSAFGTGGATAANGGAVFASSASAVGVTNSTFAYNSATAGGGFFEFNDGLTNAVSFLNSTIAQNTGGGILVTSEFSTRPTLLPVLENTLVAGNTFGDDVQGMVQSNGHNLIENPTGVSGLTSGDITGQGPRLGLLEDNGGLLLTLALLPGSPAIDAGDSAVATAAGLTTDQRGPLFARISGATVDIGAFEAQTLTATTTTLAATPYPVAFGGAVTFTATVTPSAGGTPTGGTVSFFVDGSTTAAATVPLQLNGQAIFQASGLDPGLHTVVATYNGNSPFAASTSDALTEIVGAPPGPGNPNGMATTTTITTVLKNKKHQVTEIIVTVISDALTPPFELVPPTGSVELIVAGKHGSIKAKNAHPLPLRSSTVSYGDGITTFTLVLARPMMAPLHPIFAVYSGDPLFAPSVSVNEITHQGLR